MAIIKKDRHGVFEPSRGKDEVNGMVPIDIPGFDLKTAGRCDQLNDLPPVGAQVELDRVVS